METFMSAPWYTDYFKIAACLISVLLLMYGGIIVEYASLKLPGLLRRHVAGDDELLRLWEELTEGRRELRSLSPTAEFAAYFKKERAVNKLDARYKELVNKRQKDGAISYVSLKVCIALLLYLTSIITMIYSRSLVIGLIDSSYLWPFNFVLCFPNIFHCTVDVGDEKKTVVTLYAVIFLFIHFCNAWSVKKKGSGKTRKIN